MEYTDEQLEEFEKEMEKCPFCGSKAEILHYENDGYLPKCSECDGMIEKWFDSPEEAIKHWNRRLFPTSQVHKNRLPSDDLISRKLIYADDICRYIKKEINPYGKPFEGSAHEFGLKIMEYVERRKFNFENEKQR